MSNLVEKGSENKCEFCQKTFSSKGTLSTHKKTAKYCLNLRAKQNDENKDEKFLELAKLSLDTQLDKKDFITNYVKITGKKLEGESLDISKPENIEKYIQDYCKNKRNDNDKKYFLNGKQVEKEVYYFHKKQGKNLTDKYSLFYYPIKQLTFNFITIHNYDSEEYISDDSDTDGEDFVFE
jgi:hypothetical protein